MKGIIIENRSKVYSHLKRHEIIWPGCEREIQSINPNLKFGKDLSGPDEDAKYLPAIERYDGDFYEGLGPDRKQIVSGSRHHVLILSALYGFLRPFEYIQNYACQFGDKNISYDIWTSNHGISQVLADYIIKNNISRVFDFSLCSVVAYHECINWDFIKFITNAEVIHCYHQYAEGDQALKGMGRFVRYSMLDKPEELLLSLKPGTVQNNIEFTDIIQLSENETLRRMIEGGENDLVEFKEAALWSMHLSPEEIARSESHDIKKYKRATSKFAIAKSLAGFLNTNGGNLIIGLKEIKQENCIEIAGIEDEFNKLREGDQNTDGYRLMIIDKIVKKFIPEILGNFSNLITISFHRISGKTLCWLQVKPSKSPVFVEFANDEIFFVRADASTRPLAGKRLSGYILSRFS
jgi:hypothetical protein